MLLSAKTTSLTNIELTFSEPVTVTTGAGTDFTSGDFTVSAAATGGGALVNLTVVALANGAFSSSDLNIAVNAVRDLSGGTIGNVVSTGQIVADGIAPAFVSAEATSLTNIRLTFSEQITVTNVSGGDFTSTGVDFVATNAVVFGTNQVDLTVNTLSGTDFASTDLDIALNAVRDVGALTNGIAAIADQAITDGIAPTATAVTGDDGDGFIDEIVITFSENLTGGSIDTDGGSDDFTVTGYTIASAAVTAINEVTLTLTPGGTPDTGVTPDLNILASQVTDANGVFAAASTVATTDGAAPVILAASSTVQSANAYLEVVFSEVVVKQAAGILAATDFAVATASNGGATVVVEPTLIDVDGLDITSLGDDVIRFVLSITPSVLNVTGAETVSVGLSGVAVRDAANNILVGSTGLKFLNFIDQSDLLRIISAVPQADNSYVTITFSDDVVRDNEATRTIQLANSNNGQIQNADYTNGTSNCSSDELCITFNANGSGVTIGDNNNSDIEWRTSTGTLLGNNDNYQGPSFRLYLNDIIGTPSGAETYTLRARDNSQIRKFGTSGASSEFMLTVSEFIFNLADQRAPVFSPAPSASGNTAIGSPTIFSSDEFITIIANLGETGLTVTADLTNVLSTLSATQTLTHQGGGVYSYQVPIPSKFLLNGVQNVPITATDAATNSTINSTLNVTIDSQGPALTVNSLITTDQTPLLEGLATGASSVSITIDGPGGPYGPYVSGGDVTLSGGSWSLNVPTTLGLGTFSVNVTGIDAEFNSSSDVTTNELLISNGVNVSGLNLTQICVDGGFQTGSFSITETQNGDIQQGTGRIFSIQLPDGFIFNTSVIPTFSDTQAGGNPLTSGSVSFPANNVLRITYTASAGSLGQLNDITITNVQVATNLTIAATTADFLNLGGTASILGLDVGTDLGDVGSIQPAAPVPSATSFEFYTEGYGSGGTDFYYPSTNNTNPIDLTSNNSALRWYTSSELLARNATLDNITNPSLNQWGFSDVDAYSGVPDFPGGIITYWVTQTVNGCRSPSTMVSVIGSRVYQSSFNTYFTDNDENGLTLKGDLPSTNHTGVFSGPGLSGQSTSGNEVSTKFTPKAAGSGVHTINYTLTNTQTGVSVVKPKIYNVNAFTSIFKENNDPGLADIASTYCADAGEITFTSYQTDITPFGRYTYRYRVLPFNGSGYDDSHITVESGVFPTALTRNNDFTWTIDIGYYNDTYGAGNFFIDRFDWDGILITNGSFLNNYETWTIYSQPILAIQNLNGTSYCLESGEEYDIEATISNAGFSGAAPITSWTSYMITNQSTGMSRSFNGSTINMIDVGNDGTVGLGTNNTVTYKLTLVSDGASDPNPASSCTSLEATALFRIHRVPTNPVLASNVYEYNYCSDGVVPSFDFNSPDFGAFGITYSFYEDNSGTQGSLLGQNNTGVITAGLMGLNTISGLVNSTNKIDQTKIYVTQTYSGCEGPARELFINVLYEPQAPLVDGVAPLGNGNYRFQYCQTDSNINDITLDDETLDGGYPAGSFFSWYNADGVGAINYGSPITSGDPRGITKTVSDLGLPATAGNLTPGDYVFYVTQTSYEGRMMTLGNFVSGCVSNPRKITVKVIGTPLAADNALLGLDLKTQYFTCEGDEVENLAAPGVSGVSYKWYLDDGNEAFDGGDTFVKRANSVTDAELAGAGYSNAVPGLYKIWITRVEGEDIETGFIGCEGPATLINLRVYPESPIPSVVTNVNPNHGPLGVTSVGGIDMYEFKYCVDDIVPGLTFKVEDPSFNPPGTETRKFDWFQANLVSGNIVKSVLTPLGVADPVGFSATAVDLFLFGASAPPDGGTSSRYFLISQKTNISDDWDGCDSDLVAIKVTLYSDPNPPTMVGGINDFYYCNGDIVSDLQLVDNGDIYQWYSVDPATNTQTFKGSGSSVSASILGINSSPTDQTQNLTYTFNVTRTNNDDSGISFTGCESAPRVVKVTIVPVPEEPVMGNVPNDISPVYSMCQNDLTAPTFSISNRFPGSKVEIRDEFGTLVSSINSFTPDPTYYTPRQTPWKFTVTQTNGFDLAGSFAGCESLIEEFEFFHVPTASSPLAIGNNGTSNIYTYCIGEIIQNIQIENPNPNFTYRWFSDINLNNLLTTTTSTNNDVVPSLNPSFDADVAGTYTYYVTSEVAGQGCQSAPTRVDVVINALPVVTMEYENSGGQQIAVPNTLETCVDNAPIKLFGSTSTGATSGSLIYGTFKGAGITDNGDGTAIFNPLTAVGLTAAKDLAADQNPEFTITYTLSNLNSCVDSLQRVIRVKPLTVVDFSSTISFNDATSNLLIDVSESQVIRFTGNQSNGTFTGSGTTTTSLTTATFSPLTARGGDLYGPASTYPITYRSSGTNGCFNEITKTVTVQPIPQIDETLSTFISGGCSSFDVTLTANVLNKTAIGGVSSVAWSYKSDASGAVFNDIGTGETFTFDPKALGIIPGNYIFRALVTGANGAKNSFEDVNDIGSSPEPYVAWRHIVEGSPTIFSFENRVLPDQFLKNMKLEWITAGGNTLIVERNATAETVNNDTFAAQFFGAEHDGFIFPGAGDHTVRLTMTSKNGCVATTERVVHIQPLVVVNGSIAPHTFETDNDGWWVDKTQLLGPRADRFSKVEKSNSWQASVPGGIKLNKAKGQRAMFTNPTGEYFVDENSWVISPVFDLSGLARPMVSFDRMFRMNASRDGVVLQYSTDNGDKWFVLGDYIAIEGQPTGINWYNTTGITSDPGGQEFFGSNDPNSPTPNRVGWANISSSGEDFTFASARHKLDVIPIELRSRVMFRFALASDGAGGDGAEEGFAFDNFWIGERTKQVVVEKFSSTTNSLSNTVDDQITASLASYRLNNNDLIPVAYHTEFQGNQDNEDPFNLLNKADAGARVLFYGITDVPTSILSGNVTEETYRAANSTGKPYTDLQLSNSALQDPLANITIEQVSSGATDLTFNVKLNRVLSPSGLLPSNGEHRLYVVVVEDSLEYQVGATLRTYHNVMRKILPNGNGEVISGFATLDPNTVLTFPYNWEINGKVVRDPDHLKVVAFIQSNDTKLIYQAAELPINGKQATETGVSLPGELAFSYGLYPNPANTEVNVLFDNQLNNNFEWKLIDQAGAIISNGRVQKGVGSVTLDTRNVPSGMYFVMISNENARFEPKKLLIVH